MSIDTLKHTLSIFLSPLFAKIAIPEKRRAELSRKIAMVIAETQKESAAGAALPKKAPALWPRDKKEGENSLQFLQRVWTEYMDAGLTMAMLRKLDPKLAEAARVYCINNDLDPTLFLPPTESEVMAEKISYWMTLLGQENFEEISKLSVAMAQRRSRAKKVRHGRVYVVDKAAARADQKEFHPAHSTHPNPARRHKGKRGTSPSAAPAGKRGADTKVTVSSE